MCHNFHAIKYQKKILTKSATILTKLFKIYLCPKLEYNTQVWSPFLEEYINKIESIQRNFTRFLCSCNISHSSYKNRLVKLVLKSLEYRR